MANLASAGPNPKVPPQSSRVPPQDWLGKNKAVQYQGSALPGVKVTPLLAPDVLKAFECQPYCPKCTPTGPAPEDCPNPELSLTFPVPVPPRVCLLRFS